VQTTNPRDIAVRLAQWEKRNTSRPRMVVITQGAGDVLLVDGAEHTVHTYPVAKLSADEIVDTNGAGDGFVGGA
jgi:adenosine kinase